MDSSLGGLNSFLSLGLGAAGVVLIFGIALLVIFLKRAGSLLQQVKAKAAPSLPGHRVPLSSIDSNWGDESAYERIVTTLHGEVQRAIAQQDQEELEVLARDSALSLFRTRLLAQEQDMARDAREVLQGSIRQHWDSQNQSLRLLLAVSRWNKGWRRYYEEWVIQRQGRGWFILEARPGQRPS